MPAFFPKGRAAGLKSSLDGDAARQRDALWSYQRDTDEWKEPDPRYDDGPVAGSSERFADPHRSEPS
jgi:hypothetical protein